MLFTLNKENTTIYDNMDQLRGHWAKWKPDTERKTLHGVFIYDKSLKICLNTWKKIEWLLLCMGDGADGCAGDKILYIIVTEL